jgi:hypothetical protein
MNAQRSVWSPPPTKVAQKYATYFGGLIDDPRYTDKPLIRLWWTDAQMKRLAYRELEIPAGLLALFNDIRGQVPSYASVIPPLASVTYDNSVLFLDMLDLPTGISAIYVVCDPNSVLRYGLIPILPLPERDPRDLTGWSFALDPGSWTWDGTAVWPLFTGLFDYYGDVLTCEINTRTGSAGSIAQMFEAYFIRHPGETEDSFEAYFCSDAGWVATNPREGRAILANIIYYFQYPDTSTPYSGDYITNYTVQSKYLPDGPVPVLISRFGLPGFHYPKMYMFGTYPVGPAGSVMFVPDDWYEDTTLDIVIGDRIGVRIPFIRSSYPNYYKTSSNGLPYDLIEPDYQRLLYYSNETATVFFQYTRFRTGGPDIDILLEFDVRSGKASKDRVVPSIWPEWGMEHEGDILAVPYMTSSKGRLRLP